MRHARPPALDELEPFLEQIRAAAPDLNEKNRGVFYRGSKAFLHFHEDPAGMFADIRLDGTEFERFRVTTITEQRALLRKIAQGSVT